MVTMGHVTQRRRKICPCAMQVLAGKRVWSDHHFQNREVDQMTDLRNI
jgi:hypothetical protein